MNNHQSAQTAPCAAFASLLKASLLIAVLVTLAASSGCRSGQPYGGYNGAYLQPSSLQPRRIRSGRIRCSHCCPERIQRRISIAHQRCRSGIVGKKLSNYRASTYLLAQYSRRRSQPLRSRNARRATANGSDQYSSSRSDSCQWICWRWIQQPCQF